MPRLIDSNAVDAKCGKLSRYQRHRNVKAGKFPQPVKVGNRNLWVEEEIDAYVEAQIAKRDSTREVANAQAA